MNTTFDILVIILSCLLALFLTLSIAIAILVLNILKRVRRIVAKGEQAVESAEAAAEMFKNASGPLSALKTLAGIIKAVSKHHK